MEEEAMPQLGGTAVDFQWLQVFFTALIGGAIGLLLSLLKEWFQQRERLLGQWVSRSIHYYCYSDDGKGRLVKVADRPSAHVAVLELEVRWVNRSKIPVTIDQVRLVLRSGGLQREFCCVDKKKGEPFSYCKVGAQDVYPSSLSVQVDRLPENDRLFLASGVDGWLKVRTSRGTSLQLKLGCMDGCPSEEKS